jgi:enamine deaminase RidA (YjgF/YER057c/UK114 family)
MADVVRYSNPVTLEKPPGYSHIVVFFAGQLGVDRTGAFAGPPGDFKAQTVQAFENLKAALEACGAGFESLVKITNYLVDIEVNMPTFREVRDRYLVQPPPASTTLGVPALARPGGLFEIDAVAVLSGSA